MFSYVCTQSSIQVTVADGKFLRPKNDSPSLILGIGEIAAGKSWEYSGGKARVVKTLPCAVDLNAGRLALLLYTDVIQQWNMRITLAVVF